LGVLAVALRYRLVLRRLFCLLRLPVLIRLTRTSLT
jgi:hypothetical protein